ncbi:MAG: invasion regulator SirB1 [Yersiniaceae bacterium]|uniref:Protein SirB1 N-terminal domain-containing protein n=1 Tax=Chimaeribacter coloradensis TaxID=2060068 RepID=A0A2N5EAL1_9GAMM|nr:invasion regulator SirB1 [Chimaeribacter coloradensis]MDU6412513.1 invasion regulator SirB1 [Yersiniaceae bacterium]PLR39181.1 hypothetical protein CYR32_02845 [Chimaeribacter coloradensis]
MSSVAEFAFDDVPLSAGMIRISEAIRADFPGGDVARQLRALVAEAREAVPPGDNQEQRLEALIVLFYQTWGFGGAGGIYRLSDAIWLDKVLASREGTPVSLGTLFLHIAGAIGLPLSPVIFPTQLILRADWLDDEMWLINPLNGETLSEQTLQAWIKGNLGFGAQLEDEDIDECDNTLVVRRMLDTLKASLMEEQQMELALAASQAILAFDPDDPYERRDRGLIYAHLDCEHIAHADLRYFIEQCPDDPVSQVLKTQLEALEEKRIVLH